ncbi:MAG: DUF1176 domain-containing protein [Rhizobiaceae bacterium]|nr:DUF1176 domain-containing protein [Rhizobiaceae bacterium]
MIGRMVVAGCALACMATSAPAQEGPPAYLDNRSDAASLIRSYYNAIGRKEYARAWGYYGEKKPSSSLEAFAKGFADTESVAVVTGAASEEGAAGSVFYSVPVAITAYGKDGSEKVYSGCYTARLSNPQIQAAVFTPMSIETGSLRASDTSMEASLPEKCGDGPAPSADDAALADARRIFVAAHAGNCPAIGADGTTDEPEQHRIAYRYKSDDPNEQEQEVRLFRFNCSSSAYNESHVYYLYQREGGVRELQFAEPELDIRYEREDSDEKVESIGIIGYTTSAELVNSFYDDASRTITSAAKWRGIADASSSGLWMFREGQFTLVKYDVDASYNGEIDPETVLDFHTGP